MNPLMIAGAASAFSFVKDMASSALTSPQAAQAKAGEAAKTAAGEFSKTLEAQKALSAQQAKAEEEARLAKPMTVEAQTVALAAFNARQEQISTSLQKGVASGGLNAADAQNVRSMQLAAQTALDTAMGDGQLSYGEYKQVSGSIDQASRQLGSYRLGQEQFQTQAAGAPAGYKPVSVTV